MKNNTSKFSSPSYFLSVSLAVLLTASAFHVLEIDTNAYACSCSLPASAKDALEYSDAVFSGKVTDISGKHPDNLTISRHDPVSVTFSVDRVWKGPANSTMTISTESSEASCGYELRQDETYMVYSYEKEKGDPSTLRTGLCSGTFLLSDSHWDMGELGTGTKISQLENETGKSKEENKIESIVLTNFDLYFEEDDFTIQGPNHNILRLDKGESASLNIHIKNNDDVPHQITMNDSRGVGVSGTFESFSFEPEQFTVLPHQTNSTKLHITVSNSTDTHSKFVTFLAQSDIFGMRGLGFFIVVDREIDEFVDHSMRAGMPGPAFGRLDVEISEIDAEKLIDSGFGTTRYLPQGYEFQGMDGSEGHQRFLYSPVPIMAESTGFSEFWNNGGLLIIYGIDGPNVNNTKSLPFRIAQDEGQQVMINGMMGDAIEKQTRKVAYSNTTYDFPARISFFDDATKRSVLLRAIMPLDDLLKIAVSIPVYDKPYVTVEKNTVQQQGQVDYPPPRSSDIPPLKQFKSGVELSEIQCKESLIRMAKHDGSPACMQESSVPKLIERGWAISNGNHLSFDTITPESPLAKFYVQPQITSIVLKQDSTVRVHLFSYIKEDDSDKWDHVFDRIFDEVPKNYKIGIVENTPNNINEFATLGKTNLPSGMQAELLREDGYFVVYLTLNKLSEPGNYDLAVVSIDNKGKVIQKPLFVIAVVADTAPTQDNIVKLHHSKYPWGIELENMSEQEYWTREDSRLPWPPSPILEITQDNIHHDVNELIDAMWSEDAKYIQSEYDKKTLRVENDADLNVDPKKIRDWLKVVHDEQFKENLDDSFTGYIRYDGKIYSLGFIIAD